MRKLISTGAAASPISETSTSLLTTSTTRVPLFMARVGDVVVFDGAVSSTYRVTGSYDLPKVNPSAEGLERDLPVDRYWQTCYWAPSPWMRFVGLEQI